jgi:hypothetical protein
VTDQYHYLKIVKRDHSTPHDFLTIGTATTNKIELHYISETTKDWTSTQAGEQAIKNSQSLLNVIPSFSLAEID